MTVILHHFASFKKTFMSLIHGGLGRVLAPSYASKCVKISKGLSSSCVKNFIIIRSGTKVRTTCLLIALI